MNQSELSSRIAINTRKDRLEARTAVFTKRRSRNMDSKSLSSVQKQKESLIDFDRDQHQVDEQIKLESIEEECGNQSTVSLTTLLTYFSGDFSKFTGEAQLGYMVQLRKFVENSNETALAQLLQIDIVPILLSFFSNSNSGAIGDEAAYILTYFSASQNSQILTSSNVINAITFLLKDFSIERKRQSVQILGNLGCDSEETRQKIRSLNGVEKLLEIISTSQGNQELIGSSCWAIANLIQDEQIPAKITDDVLSTLPLLVGRRILSNEEDMAECLRALSYLTVPSNYDWTLILSSNAIPVMGQLLMLKNMALANFCMIFLSQAVHLSKQAALELCKIKFYRCVQFYINVSDNSLKFNCLRIMAAIAAASPTDSYSFALSSGLNQTFVRLMREGRLEMQMQVQLLLLEMVHSKIITMILPEIDRHGYFEALVDNLGNYHNHTLLQHTLLILRELLIKSEIGENNLLTDYLLRAGIQTALQQLASHSHREIAKSASQLLDEYFSQ